MLDFLKVNTQKIHKEVEASNLSKYIIDHTIAKPKYEELLLQNYVSYKVIEQELVNKKHLLGRALGAFISSDKSERLLKDIKQINPSFSLDFDLDITFSLASRSEIIGALYVIEGSMLGGMVINRHITLCEGLKSIKTHHFFNGNAKVIMGRWKTFTSLINGENFSQNEKEQALFSAKKAFEIFGTNYNFSSNFVKH